MATESLQLDVDLLLREITRYLAVVDVFRREGCWLAWQPEDRRPEAPGRAPARLDRD
jgi:hypothetical protein